MGEKETKASEGEAPIPGKPSKEQRTANEAGGAGGVTGLESESERMQSPSPRDMGSGMASEREVSGIGSASEGKTEGDPDFDSAQAIIKSKSNITNNREGSP
ncbi:MAG: hypothetical protein ABIP13_11005, partial [Tepidiformaceae bacterium]